jgi:protein-S-isoprenylcysteine O-methyltransferase Ste14
MKNMRHLVPILVLPFNVLISIPAIILTSTGGIYPRWGNKSHEMAFWSLGIIFVILGLGMIISTIRLFHTAGKGTLAPWDPPQVFVAAGIYRYTRNPMISGGLLTLLGEVLLFGSVYILCWWVIFFTVKTAYFIFHEEPELEKRFGQKYLEYKKNVPRWVPRFKPWNGIENA